MQAIQIYAFAVEPSICLEIGLEACHCFKTMIEVRDSPQRDVWFLHVMLQGSYQVGRVVGIPPPPSVAPLVWKTCPSVGLGFGWVRIELWVWITWYISFGIGYKLGFGLMVYRFWVGVIWT